VTFSQQWRHDPRIGSEIDWFERASCRGSCETPRRQMCARCPVRFSCLYDGFKEPTGRYGGFDYDERKVFLRASNNDKGEALIAAWRSVQAVPA
jgi:hypothetical protein